MTDFSVLDNVLDAARGVVQQAVVFLREQRASFRAEAVEYKGFNDLVSYVDKGSEKILVEGLQGLIPDAGFITEENTLTLKDRDWVWIIDPLDGTTNFVHGLPCFCVSVGLTYKGNIVLGIVHEVNLDECFYGRKGSGVFLNGQQVRVSGEEELKKSLLATGFPYTNYERMKPYMDVFDFCMRHTQGIRRLGSAAVDLAYVACGRFEGFYEYGLNPWDVAAGAFLVSEAGGRVGDFKRGEDYLFGKEIVACNARIYDSFQEIISKSFGE
ncbi:MAG: inositol monophosphatase [Bacteroidia bacterium]|nr:inositol monophosphatase [Bacteroidia bacterium]